MMNVRRMFLISKILHYVQDDGVVITL